MKKKWTNKSSGWYKTQSTWIWAPSKLWANQLLWSNHIHVGCGIYHYNNTIFITYESNIHWLFLYLQFKLFNFLIRITEFWSIYKSCFTKRCSWKQNLQLDLFWIAANQNHFSLLLTKKKNVYKLPKDDDLINKSQIVLGSRENMGRWVMVTWQQGTRKHSTRPCVLFCFLTRRHLIICTHAPSAFSLRRNHYTHDFQMK